MQAYDAVTSDDAYRRLIRQFVGFYTEALFNHHWGEQAHFRPDNSLVISMVSYGLDTEQVKKVWQPFLDWLGRPPGAYTIEAPPIIGSMPARKCGMLNGGNNISIVFSLRTPVPVPVRITCGGPVTAGKWAGSFTGFESLWLPASLLADNSQERLSSALFAASRRNELELHFNKGLAGAPPEAVEAAKDTAMNPAVLSAFALAITADGQGPGYPGLEGHEPDIASGRKAADKVHRCMNELRSISPDGGAYVSESNFFEEGWQRSYWGSNHARLRLAAIKKKYDPNGLFFVHNGVGSEEWSSDGFTKL